MHESWTKKIHTLSIFECNIVHNRKTHVTLLYRISVLITLEFSTNKTKYKYIRLFP